MYLDGDAYSASSVYVKDNGAWNIYYICRDYLGSITHLTDANGVVLQETSYDAWGRLRDPQTQVLYHDDNQPDLFLRRGYTSHEHLPWFGLTNMNARLYDPVLGRFLSPDPYVQMPDFSQNFNRYSYALNNPLKFIDPDGESFIGAVVLGAVIGGMLNLNIQARAGNINSYGDMFASFGMGALAGAASGAVGGVVGGAIASSMSVGGGFAGGAITGAAAGFTGGFVGSASNSWYGGASFGGGLLSGLKSGAIGGLIGGATGGLIRGISAHNNGYNFWNGTKTNYIYTSSGGDIIDYGGEMAEVNDGVLRGRMKTVLNVQEGDFRIEKITTMPDKSIKVNRVGTYTDTKTNELSGGYARRNNSGFSAVHISPKYATGNIVDFEAIAGHELVHTAHYSAFPGKTFNGIYSERVAYNYSGNVYMNHGQIMKANYMFNTGIQLFGRGPVPPAYQYLPFLHK